MNTGVGDGCVSSSLGDLKPILDGRVPNVREDGSAVPATGGVALRDAGSDVRIAFVLGFAGRSAWKTGAGSAGDGVSVRLCVRCAACFGRTSGFRGDTFQSSSVQGAICCPTSCDVVAVVAFESVCEVLSASFGGADDVCDFAYGRSDAIEAVLYRSSPLSGLPRSAAARALSGLS